MRTYRSLKRVLAWSTATAVAGAYYHHSQLQPRNKEEDTLNEKNVPLFEWSSIPQSIAHKYVAPYPETGTLWNMGRTAVMGGVGLFAKFFLKYLANTEVHGLDRFIDIVECDRNRGLITVSNHVSVWDDPLLWGVLPTRVLFSVDKMRWVLGAADICFTTRPKGLFFSWGQAIPTIRGIGIFQPAVDFAVHKCNRNGWIHIYPEGRVNQTATMLRFKWGVSRIIMESERCPLVIPIWHEGMQHVRPLRGPFVRLFQPITLVFGDPIDFQDILKAWKAGELDDAETRIRIATTIYKALEELKKETQILQATHE
ncbi:hypothetical protein EC973_003486 [Apophysomyces ossiformis]|uniref:Tafazzin family protein n=1 Tax=Apophysomyces ossiformis TaxID=679940 RepID=A0A8H7BLG1_9FUNG|nr:hypothetical protein EC973_003486 [Apophysomyces ossiformis]